MGSEPAGWTVDESFGAYYVEEPEPADLEIQVAPITSYLAGGTFRDVVSHLRPTRIRCLDIYVGEGLVTHYMPTEIAMGVPLRECVANPRFDPGRVANDITKIMGRGKYAFSCTCLTSYFPEITRDELDSSITAARKVVELGRRLLEAGQPCHCIELVGGRTHYVEGNALKSVNPERLFGRLRDALRHIADAGAGQDLWLAVEVEPGPGCLLGRRDRVVRLIDEVHELQADGLPIGINIDLAHMRAMGPGPEGMTAEYFNRRGGTDCVVHAHINDGPGFHTPDREVTDATTAQQWWSEWMDLLVPTCLPPVGKARSLSIELEAIPDPAAMVRSFEVVVREIQGRLSADAPNLGIA